MLRTSRVEHRGSVSTIGKLGICRYSRLTRVPVHRRDTRSARSLSGPLQHASRMTDRFSSLTDRSGLSVLVPNRGPGLPCTAPVADDSVADKTGFDPRHRVSSVIFESFFAPYRSSRPVGVRATRSFAKDPFPYDILLPPSDEFVLELALGNLQNTSRLPSTIRRSLPGTISVRHLLSPGGAPTRLRFLLFTLPGRCAYSASSVVP